MKIKDIIVETKQGINNADASAISGAVRYPQMDNSYELYRFGISMAGQPGIKSPTSTIGDIPVIVPYSKGDEEIVASTERIHKTRGKLMTSKGSKELNDTNIQSPTAKPKRNRFGV